MSVKILHVLCEGQTEQGFVENPELVNDRPDSAPSKRIIKAIEGNKKIGYSYDKPKAGKFVAEKVGMVQLRAQCSHFNSWIETLINK